jgi:rhodanese-related sulfurtransferase
MNLDDRSWPTRLSDHRQLPGIGTQRQQFGSELEGFDWEVNPHFVGEVKKLAGHAHDRPVVLISRNRVRSAEAGAALEANGFSRVYTVKNGFEGDLDNDHHRSNINGWCHDGLPWQQC